MLQRMVLVLLACLLLPAALAETITLNAEDDWAPFSARDAKTGAARGFAVEVVRAAFASQGVKVQFRVVPFTRCLREVEQNQTLGCFDVEKTGYNRDRFHWHNTPLLEEPLAIFALTPMKRRLTVADLAEQRVGLTRDYTYPSELMAQPGMIKDYSRTDEQQLRKLLAGRIRFAIINASPAQLLISRNEDFRSRIHEVGEVNIANFYVGFAREHPESAHYAAVLDKGLAAIRDNGVYASLRLHLRRHLAGETAVYP
ncbi:substrate-binding periplasmic protein [Chitinilyticum piscinae]|uniref:Transporter substrate-binding domain-containing protein n=1 Tax=Chitinilyticum piscinae TaxID=2866724 RepID=A0A8J7FL14_9NEIS|nr:transporter substrate-binding domain-containing protein [Chitinilyticum piscinae]MBE9608146.1 transporter substrate-binding domain-containing protein [Chitinilyticum piscinae]